LGKSQNTSPGRAGDRGFTLVVVIWALALLAAIAASLTSATRTAALIAANGLDNAQAEALADAGVRLAVLDLGRFFAAPLTATRVAVDGTPRSCRIADLGSVSIGVESETGKVDINSASDALLQRLLSGVGGKDVDAAGLIDKMADFRDADGLRRLKGAEAEDYRRAGAPNGPKDAPFAAVEELGEVLGMPADLAARLRPFVTVYSGTTGLDPSRANPSLLRVLTALPGSSDANLPADANSLPAAFVSQSAPRVFLIRGVSTTPVGAHFVREAVVEIRDARLQKLDILRWYRGELGAGQTSSGPRATPASGAGSAPATLPPC